MKNLKNKNIGEQGIVPKQNSGITLIALVVTIIVLLILAGVSLNLVAGSNGILERATKVADTYDYAKLEESLELSNTEMWIDCLSEGNLSMDLYDYIVERCEQSPDETAQTPNGKYWIDLDGKFYYTDSDTNRTVELGKATNGAPMIIGTSRLSGSGENIKRYKIFYEGNNYEAITQGWTLTRDSYSNFISETNAIHANRYGYQKGGWAISTNVAIDISNYTKLCCRYTADSNNFNDGLRLRLNQSQYVSPTGRPNEATYNSDSFEYDRENGIFEWDISQIEKGLYYIGIGGSGASDTYIYEIWLE